MTSDRSGDIYLAMINLIITRIVLLVSATGVDRPSSVSSAGARGASDEVRGSSSMFALSLTVLFFYLVTRFVDRDRTP